MILLLTDVRPFPKSLTVHSGEPSTVAPRYNEVSRYRKKMFVIEGVFGVFGVAGFVIAGCHECTIAKLRYKPENAVQLGCRLS